MKIIEADFTIHNQLIAIVISRFNYFINKNLLEAAIDTLTRIGKIEETNITIIKVPGTYEIPIITKNIAKKKYYNAIITLGTIIKGSTDHFQYIAKEVSANLIKISLHYNIPISFGILITNNIEQAIERAGTKMGNKGYESALSVLETINILKIIK